MEEVYPQSYVAHVRTFSPAASLASSGWHPAVFLATLLCASLHLVGHLPFRFCNVVLSVIGMIFCDLGAFMLAPALPTSLAQAMSALHLVNLFLPSCPHCRFVCPEARSADRLATCPLCKRRMYSMDGKQTCPLQIPYLSLVEQLTTFLSIPGNEDRLGHWRTVHRVAGHPIDIFDGAIMRGLLGPDGLPFFRFDLDEDPNGEIRIALVLGADW